jgi:L-ascorbate metabolism protein UlaG (beta-lactamase superfamily)
MTKEMVKYLKKGITIMIFLMLIVIGSGLLFFACAPQMGAVEQNSHVLGSANFLDGRFQNSAPVNLHTGEGSMIGATLDFLRGNPERTPSTSLPTVNPYISDTMNQDDLRVTWLGHSTCLIQIDGFNILTDPMFSDRASPFSFLGPKQFKYDASIELQGLPRIDAVLISHDHYDHLDYRTIQKLDRTTLKFYVPLGVAGHLKRWGVEEQKIVELDWWEQTSDGTLTFIATPAQHFSGRGLNDKNKTLWASWVIKGKRHRVFFSGDSGYFTGFKKIGDMYGPFDLTMLESGAYNKAWADVHMMPEQTVQAHIDLQGEVLLPIHWAKFNLALHPWHEPIERLTKKALAENATVITPRIGESFTTGSDLPQSNWWKLAMK